MNKQALAQEKDQQDPLAKFRSYFTQNENEIYLDGNSLGKLPLKTKGKIVNLIEEQWGKKLIRSWNDHWLALPKRIAEKLALLLNALPTEIVVGESTSVNLYKLIHALVQSKQFPNQLITDSLNFPTDNYILEGISHQLNLPQSICVGYSTDLKADLDRLRETIKKTPGILCLSLVSYKSAYCYPMKELNAFAAKHKSIIVWDLSHAVGAVHIDFKQSNTLAAIGCTYKYLNGGPGAPAFLYVAEPLISKLSTPIQGWFGHRRPFDFSPTFEAAEGIEKFDAGTPPILSLAALEIGLDITLEAGIQSIQKKSESLTSFLMSLIKEELIPLGFKLESPVELSERGSHITLSHLASWRICQCLLQGKNNGLKIIPDFRPDKYIRLGIAPLYIGFYDLLLTVERLKEIILEKEFEQYDEQRPTVT